MSGKRKDTPRSPVDWFMSNLLFTQQFEFETSVDIDTVIARLHEISNTPKGWRHPYLRFLLQTEKLYDHYLFDLKSKDDSQQYTIVHATGAIEPTDEDGAVIAGEIRFGVVYFFLLGLSVLWMVFIFQVFGLRIPPFMLALVMAAPLTTFVHMFWKRHHLLKDLRETVTPRMSDRTFEKLKRDEETETIDYHDDSSQDSQTSAR